MKNIHYLLILLALFGVLAAADLAGPEAKPASVVPAKPDPAIAAITAERDNLKTQLADYQRTLPMIQQQRNQLAAQNLDLQAQLQIAQSGAADLQRQLDAEKVKVVELEKKAPSSPETKK